MQQFNLRLIIDAVFRRGRLVLIILVAVPVLITLLHRSFRPPYEASAKLMIQESRTLNPLLSDLMVDLQVQSRFPVVRNILGSRTVVEEILRELGELDEQSTPEQVERQIRRFQNILTVDNTGGGVFRIEIEGHTPEQAYNRLVLVMNTLLEEMLGPQRESLDASVEFLGEQLERMSQELADAEDRIREFKEENAEDLPEVFEGNLNRYLSTLAELQTAEADLAVAERQLSLSEEELSAYAVDPMLGEMESDLVQARERLQDLLATYTEDHPSVIRAQNRVRSLEERLEQRRRNPPEVSLNDLERRAETSIEMTGDQIPRVLAGDMVTGELLTHRVVRGEVESLRYRIERLQSQRDDLREMVRNYAGNEQALNDLIREVDAKNELYTSLSRRYQDAVLTREVTLQNEASRVWTIEAPTMPAEDNRVPVQKAALQGILIALVLAGGLVFGLEYLDQTVRLPSESEELFGLPTVAVLPKLDPSSLGRRRNP